MTLILASTSHATENEPHRPFAMWADVPAAQQWVVGLVYEESESYYIWAGHDHHNVTWHANGERYGIDMNQGYAAIQYGINDRWAVDLNVGYTTVGWRYFDHGDISSTSGLMDTTLGFRYQFFNETNAPAAWVPTLTFRAGGIIPGSFSQEIEFAPGQRSAALEPEILVRKHFGWPGFGVHGDALYRWNKTTSNDQYIIALGFLQQIQRWEFAAGYRHLQSVSGNDITWNGDGTIDYPRSVRENQDAIEAGFSYTTSKRHIRWGFHSRTVVDGSNTDNKFWVGGSVDIPFGGKKSE